VLDAGECIAVIDYDITIRENVFLRPVDELPQALRRTPGVRGHFTVVEGAKQFSGTELQVRLADGETHTIRVERAPRETHYRVFERIR